MNEEIKYQEGQMEKDPRDMIVEECEEWYKRCAKDTREYLFSIGQPLVYRHKNGHTIAEYKNGHILVVRL